MTHFLDHRTRSPLCRSSDRVRWSWTSALAFVTCRRCRDLILSLGARTAEDVSRALERMTASMRPATAE